MGVRLTRRFITVSLISLVTTGILISVLDSTTNYQRVEPEIVYLEKAYGNDHYRRITHPVEIFNRDYLMKGDVYRKYQLNVNRSDELPLDRKIPDTRPETCKGRTYDENGLPSASIVIPFHNEAWSVFLRTIVSILNRTPPRLLREIILVDDASTYSYLKEPLRKYLDQFGDGRIKLLRKTRREGLIVARMLGAHEARGDVLIFLDAHVEVNVHWIQPLLAAVKADPSRIAIPNIDDIQVDDLAYISWHELRGGGFRWDLSYEWKRSPLESKSGSSTTSQRAAPFPTATTIGCAMAIQRNYFFEMGAYDEGMHIWGGENLEISFRNWMCGGSLYVYPCSRVGHIFRKFLPYDFPAQFGYNNVIKANLQRVAEVWMDDYKKYYFAAIRHRKVFNMFEEASLEERKSLRKRLNCKGFSWYLHNVLPELPLPPPGNPKYHGQLKSALLNRCLYRVDGLDQEFELGRCYAYDSNNTFSLTQEHGIVMPSGECLIHDEMGTRVSHDKCDVALRKGNWEFNTENVEVFKVSFPKTIENLPLGQVVFTNKWGTACLASSQDVNYPYFMDCNAESIRQYWYFSYEFNYEFAR